ncbi:hypothetical protein [Nocardioides sp. Arc9.136]|uniref:hypothetical protein n=1 Tax=Nocardioides sp. Arc9.136 TaxID=2996826 RepID=UPI002666DE47|nr:hypothetical protein [Nocardioides sp. Arc9.136]WKN48105.1 hypothetical protein OSR43_18965 [Nocardioides sp. Arc9.136]
MAQESEPADLLDRWLTHREQGGAARTPVAGAVDSGSATDVDAEDPLFDESFEPAPEEVEAPLFEASAPQELQLDFEPVIIPSARRRQERAGSRRGRLRPRRDDQAPEAAGDPVADPEADPVVTDAVPEAPAEVPAGPTPEEVRAAEARVAEEARVAAGERIAAQLEAARVAERETRPARPVRSPAPPAAAAARATVDDASTNHVFRPRTGARRVVGLLLLVLLAATAGAAYAASRDQTTTTLGLAGTLAVLTLVVWAVRAGSAPTRMSVTAGQLEVLRGGGRFVFDLRSPHTPIEVVGEPGSRGWKVLFLRRSMEPFVVDSTMVDPEEFTAVLRRHRPERTA